MYTLKIPENLPPDTYDLVITGGYGYLEFMRKSASYKFVPENLQSLVEIINDILSINREKLYCIFVLPASGLAVGKAELPDFPPTKALVLADSKRTLKTQSFSRRLEQKFSTGTIIVDNPSC